MPEPSINKDIAPGGSTVDSDQIASNAANPKRASADGTSAEQFSISDQIMADQYAKTSTAMNRNHRGIRFSKFTPPGTR